MLAKRIFYVSAVPLCLAALSSWAARAAVFSVPPITITHLTHQVLSGRYVWDSIEIPGSGYTSSGFTSAFTTGDVVRVRVQPPAGKMFRVHASSGGYMTFNVFWQSGSASSSPNYFNPPTVATFESLNGVAPTQTYHLTIADEQIVEVWFDYTPTGDFGFTAFVVDITVDQSLAAFRRTYGDASSYASPSIGASCSCSDPNFVVFEIVDIPVPTRSASWGRIKALYR